MHTKELKQLLVKTLLQRQLVFAKLTVNRKTKNLNQVYTNQLILYDMLLRMRPMISRYNIYQIKHVTVIYR